MPAAPIEHPGAHAGAPADAHRPLDDFDLALGDGEVGFAVDVELYPLDAIYGAVHLLLDRAYVYLSRPDPRRVHVRLRPRGDEGGDLEAAAGELANELLNQVLRARIGARMAAVRELYLQRAFFAQTPTHSAMDAARAEEGATASADSDLFDELAFDLPWDD